MSKTRFYWIWVEARRRCRVTGRRDEHRYAGRGITVCRRWLTFSLFKEDMYNAYIKHVERFGELNTQIERVDNDKGYSPQNCRWATRSEQARNRSTNKIIVAQSGLKMTLTEWDRFFGLPKNRTGRRIKSGWFIDKNNTFVSPKRNLRENQYFFVFKGERVPLRVLTKNLKIKECTVLSRLFVHKWSLQDAISKPLKKR